MPAIEPQTRIFQKACVVVHRWKYKEKRSSFHDRLIVIHHRLGQHGQGRAFGGIDGRVARGVADGQQLLRIGPAGAELVVLLAVESLQGLQLALAGTSAGQASGR